MTLTNLAPGSLPTGNVASNIEGIAELLLHHELSQFLYAEARLLTENRWQEWLDLMADDMHYYMPIRENLHPRLPDTVEDPLHLSLFDDDKEFLTQRVQKFGTGVAWSEDPRSRTTHLVTNIQVENVEEGIDGQLEYTVASGFLINRNRLEDEVDTYTGTKIDRIRRTPEGLRFFGRRASLDESVVLAKNLSIFF